MGGGLGLDKRKTAHSSQRDAEHHLLLSSIALPKLGVTSESPLLQVHVRLNYACSMSIRTPSAVVVSHPQALIGGAAAGACL